MFSLLDTRAVRTIKKMAIIVYSAITGGKDNTRDDIKTFGDYSKFVTPVMNAKIYKILPHLFFDVDYSVWIDGNVRLKIDPQELVEMMGDKDIAVFPNPYRTDPIDEANYCLKYNIGNPKEVLAQIDRYSKMKPLSQLSACGIIVRRHTEEMKQLCEKWWAEICVGSNRDQISFPFVFPEDKIKFLPFQSNFKDNDFFKRIGHIK